MGGDLFGVGFGELLFLAILALLVFGPRRLPEIARGLGRFLRQVRQATGEVDREFRQWMQGLDRLEEASRPGGEGLPPPAGPLETPGAVGPASATPGPKDEPPLAG